MTSTKEEATQLDLFGGEPQLNLQEQEEPQQQQEEQQAAEQQETVERSETPEPREVSQQGDLRAQWREKLRQGYALSEAEIEAFASEPHKMLPGLLARVHENVVDSVTAAVVNVLPSLLASFQKTSAMEAAIKQKYPGLNVAEVRKIAEGIIGADPGVGMQEAMEVAASLVSRRKSPKPVTSAPVAAPRGFKQTKPASPWADSSLWET